MHQYPDNLKASPNFMLWKLRDFALITILLIFSFVVLATTKIMILLTLTGTYAILSIQIEETSILDYMIGAYKFCISRQQVFFWEWMG